MDRTFNKFVSFLQTVADLSPTDVNRKIVDIFNNYQFMHPSERKFLYTTYVDSYNYGNNLVDNKIFTNNESTSKHDLEERFLSYPKVSDGNINFLESVKSGSTTALDDILARNESLGLNDFIYDMYEGNYIDGSNYIADQLTIPDTLEHEAVELLSQIGFADGVNQKLDKLAKKQLQVFADETLEDGY